MAPLAPEGRLEAPASLHERAVESGAVAHQAAPILLRLSGHPSRMSRGGRRLSDALPSTLRFSEVQNLDLASRRLSASQQQAPDTRRLIQRTRERE